MQLRVELKDDSSNTSQCVYLYRKQHLVLLMLEKASLDALSFLSNGIVHVGSLHSAHGCDSVVAAAVNLANYASMPAPLDRLASLAQAAAAVRTYPAAAALSLAERSSVQEVPTDSSLQQALDACNEAHLPPPCSMHSAYRTNDVSLRVQAIVRSVNNAQERAVLQSARANFRLGLDALLSTHVIAAKCGIRRLERTTEMLLQSLASPRAFKAPSNANVASETQRRRKRHHSVSEKKRQHRRLELQRELLMQQRWADDPAVRVQYDEPEQKRWRYKQPSASEKRHQQHHEQHKNRPSPNELAQAEAQLRQYSRELLAGCFRKSTDDGETSEEEHTNTFGADVGVTLSASLVHPD